MSAPVTPEVLWAQRSSADEPEKNIVYLTITAADLIPNSIKLDLTSKSLSFSGENKTRKYAVELKFYAEIDESLSKKHISGRGIEYVLRKKEAKTEFWPRLLEEPKKLQFIKTDFDKWVDEDEQEEEIPDDMGGMGSMGGMGGGGMNPVGDMGGMDFANMMSSMGGGAGGMPDLSALGGAGGDAGVGADDDDDDIPELEDTSDAKDAGKAEEAK